MATKKKLLQAAAGSAGGGGLNVEELFSIDVYDGNSSNQTITNGIDFSGEGGFVWYTPRTDNGATFVTDTERGATKCVFTNEATAETTLSEALKTFSSTGFTLGNLSQSNGSGHSFIAWSFRKAPKFVDVQTWSGNSTSGRTISHNLDAEVGCIMVKRRNVDDDWTIFHRSVGNTAILQLNKTNATYSDVSFWNNTSPTTTEFTLGDSNNVNETGSDYVAYLFAHNDDDGEFGPDGDADIIKCGSFTASSAAYVDLGFEPQWFIYKRTDNTSNWAILDARRGFYSEADGTRFLNANTDALENDSGNIRLTSNGFYHGALNGTWAYIAIRRGPMAAPESATDVFDITFTNQDSSNVQTDLDTIDMNWQKSTGGDYWFAQTRLRYHLDYLKLDDGSAEAQYGDDRAQWDTMGEARGYTSSDNYIYSFKRAPKFFDCVVKPIQNNQFKSDGAANNYNSVHNLGVTPEFIIVKDLGRAPADGDYFCYHSNLGTSKAVRFNEDGSEQSSSWQVNENNFNFYSFANSTGIAIAWMWASLAGVSKVGSYTGTGGYVLNDCGFSSGARLVIVKRTDANGDWYLWDAERGITSSTDPYYLINSANGTVTNTDYIQPDSRGFYIHFAAPAALNASGGNYIYLAIA